MVQTYTQQLYEKMKRELVPFSTTSLTGNLVLPKSDFPRISVLGNRNVPRDIPRLPESRQRVYYVSDGTGFCPSIWCTERFRKNERDQETVNPSVIVVTETVMVSTPFPRDPRNTFLSDTVGLWI